MLTLTFLFTNMMHTTPSSARYEAHTTPHWHISTCQTHTTRPIRYFVSETKGNSGADQRGAVEINPGTTLSVNGSTVSIINPDRTWILEASSPDEAAQ